ncbi:hypothetical protein BX600DRAFT_540100 [Xylariales sp. PMI_506]|nr:hypothetical protein BX600DRAFT_540100 [Xylariales sp. PMI_506]
MSSRNRRIAVPVLQEVQAPGDDWTGVTDAKARRKLQNRLNVRAHIPHPSVKPAAFIDSKWKGKRKALEVSGCGSGLQPHYYYCYTYKFPGVESRTMMVRSASPVPPSAPPTVGDDDNNDTTSRELATRFGHILALQRELFSTFPLSRDHLIPVLQFNVLRAIMTNMSILPYTQTRECEALYAAVPMFQPLPPSVPESLRPTFLQLTRAHPPAVDIIPCPQMRDNIISAMGADGDGDGDGGGGGLDLDELEADATGGLCDGPSRPCVGETGLLVWTDPWLVDGWEVTPGFARKWGRLLQGCDELLRSSNRWRALRGEDPLVMEV